MPKSHSDIGLIGLAVMGQNLALNIADHGFQISVYNRTTEKTDKFVAENPHTPGGLVGAKTLQEFVQSLSKPAQDHHPRAGRRGDRRGHRQPRAAARSRGHRHRRRQRPWTDTIRREKNLREKGLRFIGSGVSGGEDGARFGPSLMPGGDPAAYKELKPIWEAIAAKVDAKTGEPLIGRRAGQTRHGRRALHDLHRARTAPAIT